MKYCSKTICGIASSFVFFNSIYAYSNETAEGYNAEAVLYYRIADYAASIEAATKAITSLLGNDISADSERLRAYSNIIAAKNASNSDYYLIASDVDYGLDIMKSGYIEKDAEIAFLSNYMTYLVSQGPLFSQEDFDKIIPFIEEFDRDAGSSRLLIDQYINVYYNRFSHINLTTGSRYKRQKSNTIQFITRWSVLVDCYTGVDKSNKTKHVKQKRIFTTLAY